MGKVDIKMDKLAKGTEVIEILKKYIGKETSFTIGDVIFSGRLTIYSSSGISTVFDINERILFMIFYTDNYRVRVEDDILYDRKIIIERR